jgi:hypothetical protein
MGTKWWLRSLKAAEMLIKSMPKICDLIFRVANTARIRVWTPTV